MQKVAVYGSLRKGFYNHRLLEQEGVKLLGIVKTEPIFNLWDLGAFPAITLNGETPIVVEVYEVSDRVFASLDRLEGYPSFYNRKLINTEFGEVYIYFLNRPYPESPLVESGDWYQYKTENEEVYE